MLIFVYVVCTTECNSVVEFHYRLTVMDSFLLSVKPVETETTNVHSKINIEMNVVVNFFFY